MFRRLEDFAEDFQDERTSTIKVMRALTDESLSQEIVPGGRSLGFLAWHLTLTFTEMLGHAGLDMAGPALDEAVPSSAAAIVEAYEAASSAALAAVMNTWSDDMLNDDLSMYGQTWKRGFVLDVLVRHEAHHRGQMTVLMRQAGLAVPGPYGPGREEWAAMGMEPQP